MTVEEINEQLKKCDHCMPLHIWVNNGSQTQIFELGRFDIKDSLKYRWIGGAAPGPNKLSIMGMYKLIDGNEILESWIIPVESVAKIVSLRMVVDSHDSK